MNSNSNKQKTNLLHKRCYVCNSTNLQLVCSITKRPEQETDFGMKPEDYCREINLCLNCRVYNNFHNYDFDELYSGKYNEAKYNSDLLTRYDAIMNLPLEKSDNKQRVKRIVDFCKVRDVNLKNAKVLDVGSGLCVFLGELLKYGVEGYCIDIDPISIKHALRNVKVKDAHVGSFIDYGADLRFDIITFNKVLEHVTEPVSLLRKAKMYLKDTGIVYVELPDGFSALKENALVERQEFFIEHYTIFNKSSLRFLIKKAGFICAEIRRVHEPSDKYTLYAFCKNCAEDD